MSNNTGYVTLIVNDDDLSEHVDNIKEFFINKSKFVGLIPYKKTIIPSARFQHGIEIVLVNHKYYVIFDIEKDRDQLLDQIKKAFLSEERHSLVEYCV